MGGTAGIRAEVRPIAELNPKQEQFCREYLLDFNATQAAIRAGYSPKTANEQGAQLLAKLSVAQRIEELTAARAETLAVKVNDVVAELARMGFANILDYVTITERGHAYVDLSKMTREQAAAIGELTSEEYVEGKGEDARLVKRTKIKLVDKRGPLELLGKHLGMFPTKVDLNVDDKRPDLSSLSKEELLTWRELAAKCDAEPARD